MKDTAAQRLGLTRDLGNSILSRRFHALSRQADAKILGAGAYYDDPTRPRRFQRSAFRRSRRTGKKLAVGEQELRRAVTHGFTKAEMDEQLAPRCGPASRTRRNMRRRAKSADLADAIVSAANEETVSRIPKTI